ncbi:MAG: hypothetical protein KBB83_07005 [Alphaproteobacteria bacterium]|nr:hypothetical protein [Alphaproteobacteria bacterium]
MENKSPPPYFYKEFIRLVFDHQPPEGSTETGWYTDSDYPLDFPLYDGQHVDELVDLYHYLFLNCEKDLAEFSDIQVALGIQILFNQYYSNLIFDFMESKDERKKVSAILSMKNLYKHVFEKRCVPDEQSAINHICFMLWDVSPLDKNKATLQVMEYALYSSNKQCILSGLHGLGHVLDYKKEREDIIDKFLRIKGLYLPRDIIYYAGAARGGRVQ